MEYPGDFPSESRARVEAARIRAGRRFDSDRAKAKWNSDIEALFKSYVLTMFLSFAKEACRLGLWPVDKTRENCQEFLRLLTIEAYFQKGKAAGLRDMISNLDGSMLWEFQQKIEKTPEWRKFENMLLKVAEESTGEKQAESSRPQNLVKTAKTEDARPLTHSEDYLSVTLFSQTYTLTPRQAQIIEILHEAHESGSRMSLFPSSRNGLKRRTVVGRTPSRAIARRKRRSSKAAVVRELCA